MKAKYCSLVLILIPVLFMLGCGEGGYGAGGEEAPPSSTVTCVTGDISASIVGTTTWPISVKVLDSKGNPVNDALLTISGGFAAPRVPTRYYFHRSPAGTDDVVLSPFTAYTDGRGMFDFSIVVLPSVFTDNIQIQSGSSIGTCKVTLS